MLKMLGNTHSVGRDKRTHISENFVWQKFLLDVYAILTYNIIEK